MSSSTPGDKRATGTSGRSSDYRVVYIPAPPLKHVQSRIYSLMLKHIELPDYLWAFEPNRSIPDMVGIHCGKDWVISYDIKDYFPSIRNTHLIPTLSYFGIGGRAAQQLTEICTYKYYLPQGCVTSPKLSNMVAATSFGFQLKTLCDELNIDMSVYADDITMSFSNIEQVTTQMIDKKMVDTPLLNPDGTINHVKTCVGYLNHTVNNVLTQYGFKLNHKKTKLMHKSRRQFVCGVVTNVHPNLRRRDRQWIRAVVHNICKNGIEAEAAKNDLDPSTFALKVRGKVLWFRQLNPDAGQRMLTKLDTYLDATPFKLSAMDDSTSQES